MKDLFKSISLALLFIVLFPILLGLDIILWFMTILAWEFELTQKLMNITINKI